MSVRYDFLQVIRDYLTTDINSTKYQYAEEITHKPFYGIGKLSIIEEGNDMRERIPAVDNYSSGVFVEPKLCKKTPTYSTYSDLLMLASKRANVAGQTVHNEANW